MRQLKICVTCQWPVLSTGCRCKDLEVEKVWREFWAPIVMNNDGTLNLDQVKKELFDFRDLIRDASKVYLHVTGGAISKVNTDPDTVIAVADDYWQADFEREVALRRLITPCDGNHAGPACRDAECWIRGV